MTDEQKAAYIIAQAVCLTGEIAGMVAANQEREALGHTIAYDESAFTAVVNQSPCHHNAVLSLFDPYI